MKIVIEFDDEDGGDRAIDAISASQGSHYISNTQRRSMTELAGDIESRIRLVMSDERPIETEPDFLGFLLRRIHEFGGTVG